MKKKFVIPNFSLASILVVGDIILDQYWTSKNNSNFSSYSLSNIIKINSKLEYPGGAANVAMNIASLGAHVFLIGLAGKDEFSKRLNHKLKKSNIVCDFIKLNSYSTITKTRVLLNEKELFRLDYEKKINSVPKESLLEKIRSKLKEIDIIILSDYKKGSLNHIEKIIELAKKENVPVLIDPKGKNFDDYKGATILTPNLFEFEGIVGPCKTEKELIKKGKDMINNYNLLALLITRSSQGMTLLTLDKSPINFPAKAKKISDVTGAGDTVISVLATSLAIGNNLQQSCLFASIAAGIVVEKTGTSTINIVEFKNSIFEHYKNIK